MAKKKEETQIAEKPVAELPNGYGRILAYVDGNGRVLQWFFPDIQETNLPADEHLIEVVEDAYLKVAGRAAWISGDAVTDEAPPSSAHVIDESGKWVVDPDLLPHAEEQEINEVEKKVRLERAALLRESDWVSLRALESGAEMPQEWIDYRQALRDLPEQPGFPLAVSFPISPGS